MKSTALSTPSIPPASPPAQAEIAAQHQWDIDFLIRHLRAARHEAQRLRQENESLEEDLIDEHNRADELAAQLEEMQQHHKAELVEIVAQLRSGLLTKRDLLGDWQELDTRHADALRAQYALVQKIEGMMIPADAEADHGQ